VRGGRWLRLWFSFRDPVDRRTYRMHGAGLMLFKYGKQRGYLLDWVQFHTKPHVYSGPERDTKFASPYLTDGDE